MLCKAEVSMKKLLISFAFANPSSLVTSLSSSLSILFPMRTKGISPNSFLASSNQMFIASSRVSLLVIS